MLSGARIGTYAEDKGVSFRMCLTMAIFTPTSTSVIPFLPLNMSFSTMNYVCSSSPASSSPAPTNVLSTSAIPAINSSTCRVLSTLPVPNSCTQNDTLLVISGSIVVSAQQPLPLNSPASINGTFTVLDGGIVQVTYTDSIRPQLNVQKGCANLGGELKVSLLQMCVHASFSCDNARMCVTRTCACYHSNR